MSTNLPYRGRRLATDYGHCQLACRFELIGHALPTPGRSAPVSGFSVAVLSLLTSFQQLTPLLIDVVVTLKRDMAATRRSVVRALEHGPSPTEVIIDKAAGSTRPSAMGWLRAPGTHSSRTSAADTTNSGPTK